jgi:hypothetical protein
METPFDWLTVLTFVGLAVLFLQRSTEETPRDKVWQYLPPAIGCAVVNYLGNEGYQIIAVIGLVAILAYIYYVLKLRMGTPR